MIGCRVAVLRSHWSAVLTLLFDNTAAACLLHLPVVEGLIFCISATPHLGTSFPFFHGAVPADIRVKYVYLPVELWMNTDRKMSPSLDLKRGRKQAARCPRQCPLVACGGRAAAWRRPAAGPSLGSRPQCRLSHSRCQPPVCSRPPPASAQPPVVSPGHRQAHQTFIRVLPPS